MPAQLNPTTLMNAQSAAGAGAWYNVDYMKDGGTATRSYAGTLTSGDVVTVEVALDEAKVITIVTSISATSFNGSIAYPIYSIRASKTGTTGPATVIGMV